MGKKECATAKWVKWSQIKKQVIEANPVLGKTINNMNPGEDLDLCLVRYPYGSAILENGLFYFPLEDGSLAPLDDPRMPKKIKEKLGYSGMPLSVVLDHSAELFIQTEDRIIPFTMMMKGKIFALWGVLNPSNMFHAPDIWSITAGARNIFLLPKFSDSNAYKKLARARNIKLPLPRKLLDQWSVMSQMAQHNEFSDNWHTEILFFPAQWVQEQNTEAWKDFHRYLLQEGWDTTEYWRTKIAYDLTWDLFVKNLTKQGIKVSPRAVDIVKHLLALSFGVLPGFSPAVDDEAAPVKALQRDIQEIYGFKDLFPTILVPTHYSTLNLKPVYWSLQYPTYFEGYTKPITENSALVELREVHYLMDHFCHAVLHGKIEKITNSFTHDIIKHTEFSFFHNESDSEGVIKLSEEIVKEDASFMRNSYDKSRGFALNGPFMRGCVRLSARQ